jgi:glutathione S-transferase
MTECFCPEADCDFLTLIAEIRTDKLERSRFLLALYHYNNSICSERVRMVLHEKRVTDYVDHHIDLFAGEQFAPEYIKLNPKAETPTLVHDGAVIRESSLVCEYIDDVYAEPALKPQDPVGVAHMREWVKRSDDQLYEAVASLSFVSIFRQTLNDKGDDAKEKHFRSQTDLSRLMRQRSCVESGFDSAYVVRSVSNVMQLMEDLDEHLKIQGAWLLGEQYTLAEIDYSPFFARLEALEMLDVFLEGKQEARRWWDDCKSRECFAAAAVGPAAGVEAERYAQCGRKALTELESLINRIHTSSIYDLL